MDFFGYQERARARTKRLVLLFVFAVGLTILAVYLALSGVFQLRYILLLAPPQPAPHPGWFAQLAIHFGSGGFWNPELAGWVSVAVLTILVSANGCKQWQLSRGGSAVAQLLGGRLLDLNTGDSDERQLLNVVEEMAVATGLPVPDVYLLHDENGINAFAAGRDSSDAVIGVTFGALKLLTRDEMQGVVAHEFSHILNGDTRLNLHLIGWLHGLLVLVVLGRVLTLNFASPREIREAEPRTWPVVHPVFLTVFVVGCICLVAGSLGAFFARWIKSAVSRQREYLADAAAVQFTRNPAGLAGALQKIGGLDEFSTLRAGRAEEVSHMYFSDGMPRRWFGFLSTHPPLAKRIRRIDPSFDGTYPAVSLERVLRESKVTALYREQRAGNSPDFKKVATVIGTMAAVEEMQFVIAARDRIETPVVPAAQPVLRTVGFSPTKLEYAARFLNAMPEPLREATLQPFSAVALVYGMICSKDPETRARQLADITETAGQGIVSELSGLLSLIEVLDAGAFLPLADLCVRALRRLSPPQYDLFRSNLRQLVEHDGQIDLFEYMLERMIVRHLDPHFRKVKRPLVQSYVLKPLLPDCAVLLSGLARIGQETEELAGAAFQLGAAQLTAEPEPDLRFLPFVECNLLQMDAAMDRVAQASPRVRHRILNALACAATTDGQLQQREAELLRAMADACDLPVPPYLCGFN